MKRTVRAGAVLAATLLVLAAPVTSGAAQARGDGAAAHFYTTKTPYTAQERPRDYQPVPRGYVAVFTENVARHGSRAMSNSEDGDAVLAVTERAQAEGGLTGLGAALVPQVRTLLTAGASIGYGNLSGLGAREQRETALRMERRLPGLFAGIAQRREPIEVQTSGVARAVASANAFTGGLAEGDPALSGLIQAPVTNKDLLYFHKQPQNADYQAYVDSDPDLAAVLERIDDQPRTAQVARHVVSRLFEPGFVAGLSTAEQISFARSLFELYSAAPDLRVEAPHVDLDPFLPPSDAAWLAYLDDAEEYYQSGPAFAGRTITFKLAGVLLDDLFAQVEAKANGTSGKGAVLRFTHAEEIEPLAVLLGLPGSTKQSRLDQPYTYEHNPWRGETVAPMGANVQWDLYAKGGTYLVRMLYNERETAFPPSCRPIARGSYFYRLSELERCFNR
ncbi:histidine-type phosphatase [Dactylosporangium sp. CA-092794]|uniref:histidine-type phosphatase n=1 Tax=Dactylosporangium sp. CA-092794 TaxID=3239929 RepID=UPI003D8EBE43